MNTQKQTGQTHIIRSMPWILLGVGLLLTYVSFNYVSKTLNFNLHETFELEALKIETQIKSRMQDYELALLSTRGLFQASTSVERDEFKQFVEALQLQTYFPGIQGIGFSEYIGSRDNVPAFEEGVRNDGFPEFEVFPNIERDEYHSIKYLEPFDTRNQAAFGYDMHSEEIRRSAMDLARDTGKPSLSGRVHLLQEIDEDVQPGTLLYVPVYNKALPTETVEERRRALLGFVYAPFRMHNLFQSVIQVATDTGVDIEIYDYSSIKDNLLYSNEEYEEEENSDYIPLFEKEIEMFINGRPWILEIHSAEHFEKNIPIATSIITLVSGLLITILVTWISYTLVRSSETANQKAKEIVQEMQRTEETWKLALEANGDGVWDWNMQTNEVRQTPRCSEMLGYEAKEVGNTKEGWMSVIHPDDKAKTELAIQDHIQGKNDLYVCENRMKSKDGTYKWLLNRGKVVAWLEEGKPLRMIGTLTDMSEQKKIEEQLYSQNTELERANSLMINRELRMKELKEEIRKLKGSAEPTDPE